jgi:hypothetical protein
LILLAEKMELLAARLRRSGRKGTSSLPNLEAALDAMLIETDNSGVLPSSIHVAPSATSGWQETRKSMMPAVKMKRKAAGDAAYGGGASSGGKAKDRPDKRQKCVQLPLNCAWYMS